MRRRSVAVVAAGAVAGGAGWLWRTARDAGAADPAADALRQAALVAADGAALPMARFAGRPLVLNFWATWCAPCIVEMPELDRFHRDHAARGWRVLGLAIDNPAAVRAFLAARPVGYPVAVAGFDGTQWARRFGNDGGALPFTLVFDAAGRPRWRKLGETNQAQLARAAAAI